MKFSLRPTSKTDWHDTFVFALVIKPRKKLIYNLQECLLMKHLDVYSAHSTDKQSFTTKFICVDKLNSIEIWKRIGSFFTGYRFLWISKQSYSFKVIYENVYIDWHLSVVYFYIVYLHFYCSIIKELQKGRILWRCK